MSSSASPFASQYLLKKSMWCKSTKIFNPQRDLLFHLWHTISTDYTWPSCHKFFSGQLHSGCSVVYPPCCHLTCSYQNPPWNTFMVSTDLGYKPNVAYRPLHDLDPHPTFIPAFVLGILQLKHYYPLSKFPSLCCPFTILVSPLFYFKGICQNL